MKHGGSWYTSSRQVYKWLHWVWCRVACDHRDECEEWKKWKKKGIRIVKVDERA